MSCDCTEEIRRATSRVDSNLDCRRARVKCAERTTGRWIDIL